MFASLPGEESAQELKRIFFPSGDHFALLASIDHGVSCARPVPSSIPLKLAFWPLGFTSVKASHLSSGDQFDRSSSAFLSSSSVTRRGMLPSALTMAIPSRWTAFVL